jgi:DNA polymerase-1
MEHQGVRIDVERLAAMGREIDAEMARLEAEIFELAGHPFNVSSPPQLRTVLFDELKLQPTGRRTTKTKAHSTSQEDLEALAEEHPLPARVLDYRELAKLKGTYVDALPKLVDPKDGRVHTQFNQLGAATGRLSSSDPNLQNIPIRTPIGKRIREAFVPEPGCVFVSADYSQMELRILAHLSGDPALSEAFRRDLDIHRYTAALVTGVPLEEVTAEMRSRAKAVNFGIIYGMSEFRLAREQGMTREDARAFIEAYFKRYSKVKAYLDSVMAEVQRTGQVRTLFGRIRRFPELRDATGQGMRLPRAQRDALLRQAVNAPLQGTAADIVKKAMADVAARLAADRLKARLLLQVHDELLLECPESEAGATLAAVRESMEGAVQLSIPLKVDARTGESWAAAH